MTTQAQNSRPSPASTDVSVIQAVALAVGEAHSACCVILFGSRARGDHHAASDVDLAIVLLVDALDPQQRRDVNNAATELARSVAGDRFRKFDVTVWTDAEYRTKKRSINHVAGRAWREGIVLYGSHETNPGEETVSELDNAREVIEQGRRQLRGMSRFMAPEDDEENFGFHAQRAVELALKAWVGLVGQRYERTHEIHDLIATLTNAGVAEAGPYAHLASLTPYAVKYIYQPVPDPTMDRPLVFDQILELVERVQALLQQQESKSEI